MARLSPTRRLGIALACLPLLVGGCGWLLGSPRRPVEATARAAAAAAAVEAGAAYTWLDELQARFPQRAYGSPQHAAAPAFIASSLILAGAKEVRLERLEGLTNVVAVVPGRDRQSKVILAAHHDVVHGAPGAIDDGGAIAAIIAAVRALRSLPEPPGCDVVAAIFDGEEAGVRGARAHVAALGEEGRQRVRAALAAELVGWKQDELVVHTIPSGFAWDARGVPASWLPAGVQAAAADAGCAVGLGDPLLSPCYQGAIRLLGVRTGSDAGAFLEAEIPAAMLTGSSLTNFYTAYHKPDDDMSQVDAARLDDAARVLAAAAVELAGELPRSRDLGDAYLILGSRVLNAPALALLGFACAPLLGWVAWLRHGEGDRVGAGLACGLLLGLPLAGMLGVSAIMLGVPLALGAGLALVVGRWARVPLYVGLAPTLLQGLVGAAAVASFGFRWRGGWFETGLTVWVLCAGVALSTRLARTPDQTAPKS
jgi:hypothetical protein